MDDFLPIISRLLVALSAGGLIGLERAFHGRPAGFRTHSLVCVSSSLLMLLTVYQWDLMAGMPIETIRVDPTRMAQGIMTGIGFLGAGVIMKDGLTVRGLTTAASIWITASIGIIIGMGFYIPAISATVIALVILSVFGRIEGKMPTQRYGRLKIRFKRSEIMKEIDLCQIMTEHNIQAANTSYYLEDEGRYLNYEFTIRTYNAGDFHDLADSLNSMEKVIEFSIIPTGD